MTWSDFSWRFACGDVLPYHRLQDVSYAAHGASGLRRVAFFGTGCNENLRLEHWVFRHLVINLGTDLSLNRLIQVLLWHLVLGANCHLQIGSAMLGFAHFDRCFLPPTLTWQSVLIFPNLHYLRKTSNGSRVSLWHLPWQYLDLKVSENKKIIIIQEINVLWALCSLKSSVNPDILFIWDSSLKNAVDRPIAVGYALVAHL